MNEKIEKHIVIDWDYDDFIFENGREIVSFDLDPVDSMIFVSGWPAVGERFDRVPFRRIGEGRYERIE